ncbi:MAG: endonuclease/exonuclease/phosphatase family protein [Dermatophilaceae bacterium]
MIAAPASRGRGGATVEAPSRFAVWGRRVVVALSSAGLLASTLWWWDLTGPIPAVQAAYPLVPVAAVALLLASIPARARRAAEVAALALALCAVAILPVASAPLRAPSVDRPTRSLVVMAQNLEYGEGSLDRLESAVNDEQVDVLVLVEVDQRYLRRLRDSPVGARLPHESGRPVAGGAAGTVVLSRYPMRVVDADDAPDPRGEHFQQPVVALDVDGLEVLVHGVHPLSPTSSTRLPQWRSSLGELAAWQRGQPPQAPLIMAGDFNAGWPHPAFREVADGMTDALAATGQAWRPTWPYDARIPPFVQIDHVLSRGAAVQSAGTVPMPGSDHAGVWAKLLLP